MHHYAWETKTFGHHKKLKWPRIGWQHHHEPQEATCLERLNTRWKPKLPVIIDKKWRKLHLPPNRWCWLDITQYDNKTWCCQDVTAYSERCKIVMESKARFNIKIETDHSAEQKNVNLFQWPLTLFLQLTFIHRLETAKMSRNVELGGTGLQ